MTKLMQSKDLKLETLINMKRNISWLQELIIWVI